MYFIGYILIKLNNCIKCHGKNLNNPLNNEYPKIKGQYLDYIFFSLLNYKNNFLKNKFRRINFIMSSQVQNLSICNIKNISFFINKIF